MMGFRDGGARGRRLVRDGWGTRVQGWLIE